MSLRQIAAELTARHVAMPRGGAWSITTISNLLRRPRLSASEAFAARRERGSSP